MSINFRTAWFNAVVSNNMKLINLRIQNFMDIDDQLPVLLSNLIDYCSVGAKSPLVLKQRRLTAHIIFSQYLQSVVYYSAHKLYFQNPRFTLQLITSLINHKFFLYQSPKQYKMSKTVVWIDPKEHFNVLNSVSMIGDVVVLNQLLTVFHQAFGGKTSKGFIKALTNQNKDGFTALCAASKAGHFKTVQVLLGAAKQAFGGKKSEKFRNYLSVLNHDGFTPLHTACNEGHFDVVGLLLDEATLAFGGKNTPEFQAYLTTTNKELFSPLLSASITGHFELVQLLLDTASNAYGGKTTNEYRAYLCQSNVYGFSALTATCRAGHLDLVRLLLNEAQIAFGGKHTAKFQAYLSQTNYAGFSTLHTACIKGDGAQVRLLIDIAKQAYGDVTTAGFREYLAYQNKAGFTPLNVACYASHQTERGAKKSDYEEVINVLLDSGATLELENKSHFHSTAPFFARHFSPHQQSARFFSNPPAREAIEEDADPQTEVDRVLHQDSSTVLRKKFFNSVGFGKKSIISQKRTRANDSDGFINKRVVQLLS